MLFENSANILQNFTDDFNEFLARNNIEVKELFTKIEIQDRIASSILPFISGFVGRLDTMTEIWKTDPEIVEFYKGFNIIWGNCMKLISVELSILFELASVTQKIPADEDHIKDYILARLLGRGIRTYQEITILLENGYPYGASSLTRNLFELVVIAEFLSENNAAVAKAYYDGSSNGMDHDDHYNWARASGKFKDTEHITLKKIHELAGFDENNYNDLYKTLCNFSHASSQITSCEVGTDSNDIFIGPTSFGIEAAGIYATRLVNRIALTVISNHADSDSLLKLILAIEFGEYLCQELTNVATLINSNEREVHCDSICPRDKPI